MSKLTVKRKTKKVDAFRKFGGRKSKPARRVGNRRAWKPIAQALELELTMLKTALAEQRPVWQSADGPIPMHLMEEGHLRNAISYVARRLGHEVGTALYVSNLLPRFEGMVGLLKEAQRRGFRV